MEKRRRKSRVLEDEEEKVRGEGRSGGSTKF